MLLSLLLANKTNTGLILAPAIPTGAQIIVASEQIETPLLVAEETSKS